MDKPDVVLAEWTGRDGCKWRVLRCWVGNGYRSFTQRFLDGLWV